MFSVSLTPAEVTRLECPRQDQSLLGRGHGLGLAEPLGPRWEGVIGTLAHGDHSSPFQDGFPGPLGPQEKDFPPRFHGVLSPGVLAPPRAGFGTSKGSGAGEGGVPELCRDFRG